MIPALQKPFGSFIKVEKDLPPPQQRILGLLQKSSNNGNFIICIGDFVSKSIIEEHFIPDLIVIDNYTQRTKESNYTINVLHKVSEVDNAPGEISQEAWNKIKNELLYLKKNSLNKNNKSQNTASQTDKVMSVILVKGEEDLLTLPMILEAPIGSVVMYGQPPMIGDGSSGIVLIEVSESIKENIELLLSQFDHI